MATCWRIRPTVPLQYAVEDIARRESRTISNALYRLVGEALAARGNIPSLPLPDKFDEAEARRAILVIRSLQPKTRSAIKQIATAESRSMTMMVKVLLDEALSARGFMAPEESDAGPKAEAA